MPVVWPAAPGPGECVDVFQGSSWSTCQISTVAPTADCPGAGHLDFRSILNALFETGYEGYVSGEFMPMPDPDTSARQSIAHLRQLLSKMAHSDY
jgi:hydroxypyruvate isomerase